MEYFTHSEEQIVEQEHNCSREEQVEQHRPFCLQVAMHAIEANVGNHQIGDKHHAGNNDNRLYKVCGDHGA